MSAIDVEALLAAVSDEDETGADLEYDPAFGELERAAQGKAEQQIGDEVVAAEEPNWREVKTLGVELFSRTKDLRVATQLIRALMRTDGFAGLNDGMALARGLMERYWEGVHPRLDPEDDNDPTERINILLSLTSQDAMLKPLREVPLVSSRALGRFTLRHIDVATGEAQHSGDDPAPEMSVIDAAFMDCDLEELQSTAEAVQQAVEHVTAIDALLTEKLGVSQAPDFGPLVTALRAPETVLVERLARRGVGGGTEAADGAPVAGAPAQALSGEITCREDVIRVLDKACDYFERTEPSSPVPLLLRRAKRLTSKSFMEIMRDMAPEGLTQAEVITGVSDEDAD